MQCDYGECGERATVGWRWRAYCPDHSRLMLVPLRIKLGETAERAGDGFRGVADRLKAAFNG